MDSATVDLSRYTDGELYGLMHWHHREAMDPRSPVDERWLYEDVARIEAELEGRER